jgi:hypothetical protein
VADWYDEHVAWSTAAHPGYARPGWQTGGPGSVAGGLTSRVGFRHLPIARVLNDVLGFDRRVHPGRLRMKSQLQLEGRV